MTQQYLRTLSCVLGTPGGQALDFTNFWVKFQVRRGDYQNPNSCDLRIHNLSDNTANLIQNEFSYLQINAGYGPAGGGNFGLIFQGVIKQVRKGRIDQMLTYVDVTAADGDEAYNFATIALSLAAGQASPANRAEQLLKVMATFGITKGYWPTLSTNPPPRGFTHYGLVRDELRELAQSQGLKWFIDNGQLCFVPLTSYIPGPVPVISPQTGLIGVPERTPLGVQMRTLLNPNLKVGRAIQLNSTNVNLNRYGLDSASQANNLLLSQNVKAQADGTYYVMVANHTGDTRGQEWYSDLTCLSIDSTVTPAQGAAFTPAQPPTNAIKLY